MKYFIFIFFVFVCSFRITVGQTVYEKVLIPVQSVYDHTELDKIYSKDYVFYNDFVNNVQKTIKSLSCKEYLIGLAWSYNQDDDLCRENGIGQLLEKVVKDSLRWVKIDVTKMNNISFTITARSSAIVKTVKPVGANHIFYTTILPLCDKDKNLFSKKDTNVYLELTIKANKNETQHLLFKTFKEAIYFVGIQENGNPCKFFTNPIMTGAEANNIYKKMAENVQFIGKAMKEQNDSQNQTVTAECKYKGKMLFDAMQETTVDDMKRFLSYCVLRPDTYRRNTWSIAEVYATWLVAGMPLPKK